MSKWQPTIVQIHDSVLEHFPSVMDTFTEDGRIVDIEIAGRLTPYALRNLSRQIDDYNLSTISNDSVQLEVD